MSKVIGTLLLACAGFFLAAQYNSTAQHLFNQAQMRWECRSNHKISCVQFAEEKLRQKDLLTAQNALEMVCREGDLPSCFRVGQIFEHRQNFEQANSWYQYACVSKVHGACETYGQFLAGPALGKFDGVASMKTACAKGEVEACSFVAAAAYAAGNNKEAHKYWAHICTKYSQTNFCLWGAKKFEEKKQTGYALSLQQLACNGGVIQSCETLKAAREQKELLAKAELQARVMTQKRMLASVSAKRVTVLPMKKKKTQGRVKSATTWVQTKSS